MDNIKQKVGKRVFSTLQKKERRNVYVCNINEAEHIGIIFNATHTINFEIIKELVKDLNKQNISVSTLGYVDSDSLIDHYLIRKGFDFFTRKELNWYYRPVGDKIQHFINQEFDILINLNLESFLPIDFVTVQSSAKFKVGKMFPDQPLADMMIDTTKEIEKIKELRREVQQEKEVNGQSTEEDEELNKKSDYEIQLNFLIHQVFHYLSVIKC